MATSRVQQTILTIAHIAKFGKQMQIIIFTFWYMNIHQLDLYSGLEIVRFEKPEVEIQPFWCRNPVIKENREKVPLFEVKQNPPSVFSCHSVFYTSEWSTSLFLTEARLILEVWFYIQDSSPSNGCWPTCPIMYCITVISCLKFLTTTCSMSYFLCFAEGSKERLWRGHPCRLGAPGTTEEEEVCPPLN